MIWYKFHIGDYLTHTVHLSDAEDLAYRRLLDLYYMSEKMIPLDLRVVSRKIRLDDDITESVLEEFFERTEEGYFNNRCATEVARYQAQVATNKRLGSMGGRPKKTESESKGNPKKIQIKKKNTISLDEPTTSRFDEFWNNWPSSKRKVARTTCKAKWDRQALDPLTDEINAVVARLKVSEQWLTGFDPAPLTFINQRRWEDDAGTESVSSGRRVI
jgi:uncharacterized protein YdaU (DUF1376 family)